MATKQHNKSRAFLKLTASVLAFLFLLTPLSPVMAAGTRTSSVVSPSPATSSPTTNTNPSAPPATTPPISIPATTSPQISAPIGVPPTSSSAPNATSSVNNPSVPTAKATLAGLQTSALVSAAVGASVVGSATDGTTSSSNTSAAQTLQPKTDLNTGALSFDYPIDVPAGRNGLTPDLSLGYSSQRSDNSSIIGYGWELSIPYVIRKNTHGVDQLYNRNDFTSSEDGDLKLISKIGSMETYYPLSQGPNFPTYTLDSSTNTWKMLLKNGTVLTLGDSTASRQDDPANSSDIYKWMLTDARDSNNNFISYSYFKDAGQIYPASIKYTGNGSVAGIFSVDFLREARLDNAPSLLTGFSVATNYRIYEIDASVSGSIVTKYNLVYTSGANGTKSLLNTATETTIKDGNITSLPSTTFNYQTNSHGWTWGGLSLPADVAFTNNTITSFLDAGYRILDVNGDGLADIVGSAKAYINNGHGWTSDPSWALPVSLLDFAGHDTGYKILDVNGDGLPDILGSYINNGHGWTADTRWSLPAGTTFAPNPTDPGYKIADVNGDGLPDIVYSIVSQNGVADFRTYINTGRGWTLDPTWRVPVTLLSWDGHDLGYKILDINGDGLPDIIRANGPVGRIFYETYINTGHGWAQDPSWNLPTGVALTSNLLNNFIDMGYRVLDVNSDGLADIVAASKAYINNGHGWTSDSSWGLPVGVTDLAGHDLGYKILDINGDGLPDIIRANGPVGQVFSEIFINNSSKSADLLTSITYPQGGNSQISYKPGAQYVDASGNPASKVPFPLDVVSQITTSDGGQLSSSVTYNYQGGKYFYNSAYDRKFAGFNKVTATDAAGNTTSTFYHQGDASDSGHGEYSDDEAKIGKPYRVEISNTPGNIFSKTINKWDDFDLGNGAKFVKLVQTFDSTYDGDSTHRDKATAFTYDDATGNVIQKIEYGEVTGNDDGTFTDIGTDDFTTTFSYATNPSANVLSLSDYVNVTDHNRTRVKESRFYYDNLPLGQASLGNQTKEDDWKSGRPAGSVIPPVISPVPSAPIPPKVKVLVIAGGGGGWMGGGGAGGYQYDASHSVTAPEYPVVIGTGGIGGNVSSIPAASNGNNSSFDSITAIGGGMGAGGNSFNFNAHGANGGSGGGGLAFNFFGGIGSQGGNGGDSFAGSLWVGGGGGAGGNGGNGPTNNKGGAGGVGISNSISGLPVFYAGGGGGAGYGGVGQPGFGGAGGNGGGGHGGSLFDAQAGANGLGGGGGGLGNNNGNAAAGGSGVVIISYATDGSDGISPDSTGGTKTTFGNQTIHTFTSSGTFVKAIPRPEPIPPPLPPASFGVYTTTQKTYNTFGQVTQSLDANNNATTYVYDTFNLYPSSVTNALNQSTNFSHDYSSGQVTQKTDPNGRVFQYSYDGLGRLLTEMQPDLTTPSATVIKTSYIYTDTPKNVSIQKTDYLDPLNSVTNYTYFDGLGRKIQEKKQAEAGNYETKDYLYNNLGLLDKESLPYFSFISGRTAPTSTSSLYTNYIYDPRQRVTQTTNSLGTTTNTFSDWKLTVTDPNGKTKDLSKDAYGNLMQVDEHNAGNIYSTHYAYDYLGDLTNITDAMGNIRNFTYDGLGRRLTAEDLHNPSDSSFGTWSYTYDDAGNLTRTLDPKSQTINYTYDALNRKLTEDFTGTPGVEVTNTYDIGTDGIGHLTGIVTSALTQTNSYNPLGGLKSESKVINGKTFTTNYDYDIQGNQILITNPDGSQVKNIYNEAGLLNQTRRKESTDSDFSDVVSNYDYSPTEQTTVIDYANGSVTTNTYEATKLYRLASKVTTIAAGDHAQDLSYTYDAIGNITQIIDASNTDTSKTANYTYDDLNRLTQATITNVAVDQQPYTQAFTYDAIGNILTRTETNGADAPITYTYIYNGNIGTSYANPHAVTSINDGTNTILYTYDNNGNELTKGTDKIMSLTNTWDYNNRLITADTGTNTDVYTYDASGERIMTENTKHNISPVLTTVHIESNNQDPTLAKVGDTVTLSFNSSVSLTLPKVTIVGHDATVSGTGPYTSSYILTGDDNAGKISFTIDFADASGNKGTEVTATSDSSVVNFDNPTVDPTPPPAPAPIPPDPAPSPSPDAAPAGNPNATTILSALTFAGGTNGAAAIAKLAIPAALTANASDHSITIDGVTIDLGTLALSPVEIAAKISATDFSIGTSYVADGAYTVTNDGVDTLTFTRTTSGLTGNATLAISDANYTTTNDVVPPPPTPDPTPPDPSLVPASDPVPAPLPDPAPIPPPDPVPVPPAPTPSTPNLVPNILNLNDITTLDLSAGLIPQTPIDVNAEGVTTTMVKSVVLNAETTGDPVVISNSDLPDVTLTIPDGTNIQGPELWDGNIIPPKTNTSGFQLADKIIQVGSPGNILVLDKPAMITISNSLGPVVYQTADGAASVTLPTCDGTYDAPTAPAIPNACSISNDTGTKILTYHFSTFDVSQDTTVTTIYPSNLYNIASSGSGSSTDGTKQTKQIYGSGQLTATVETVGGVVSPYYVHADHLGSTNVISDSADANVKVMDYYPFGTNRVSSGTFDPQRQYIGQLHDDDTGLDYLNARYYDGKSGQFISQDSLFWEIGQSKNGKGLLLSPQLQNSYAYSGNNPILNKDPSGKCIEDLCISEAIAFTELATQYAPQINSFLQSLTSSLGQFGLSQAGEDAHKGNFAMAAIDLAGSGEGSEVKTASEEAGTMLYRSMQEGIDGMPVLGESATTLGARIGPELDIATDENGIVHPNSGGMSVNTNPNNIPEYRRPSEFGGTGKNPMWCLGTCSLPKGLKFTLEEAKNPLNTHGFTEPAKSMGGKAFNQLIQSTKSLWKKI